MKHSKKVFKLLKRLHGKKTDKDHYYDDLRQVLYREGYAYDTYEVATDRKVYLVIYRKEDSKLAAVVKCGYFNHTIYGTYDVKLYR